MLSYLPGKERSELKAITDETRAYEPPIVVATFSIDELRRDAASAGS
jgi:hypothetical protein